MHYNISFYFNKLFLIHLQPILAHEFIKYQRVCDTWQVTAKIAQPCIFSHEISWMHGKLCNFLTKLLQSLCNYWSSIPHLQPELTVHPSISSLGLLTIHPPSPGWAYCSPFPRVQTELTVHPSPISSLSLLSIHPPSPGWAYCPCIPHLQAELTDHPSPRLIKSWKCTSRH